MGIVWDAVRSLTLEGAMGRLEFFMHPGMRNTWGGPFNGQRFRQRIFFDILHCLPISAIVETGTFRGETTALFATTSLPVYTVEINPRYFSYTKMRFLLNRKNVCLYHGDSCTFLRKLCEDGSVPKKNIFFYLDAHWGETLPLREELEIIFSRWKKPVVMIDDFKVAGYDYGFDDYGPDKTLNLDYIYPVVSACNLSIFFPAVAPSEETGEKRGCVVLCRECSAIRLYMKMNTLIRHEPHGLSLQDDEKGCIEKRFAG